MKIKQLFENIFNFLEKVEKNMDGPSDVSIAIKWRNDHDRILELCQNVIKAFMSNDRMSFKSNLKKLNKLLTEHLLEEDSVLYSVCKQDLLSKETIKEMDIYMASKREDRVGILSKLSIYALPDKTLDEVFFEGFNEIYAQLMDLFKEEELSLYCHMEEQCICKRTLIINEVVA